MTSSARSCLRKIRRTTPKSFARVAAYSRSNAASSPFATAAISQTNSAGVSIHCPQLQDIPLLFDRVGPLADMSYHTFYRTGHGALPVVDRGEDYPRKNPDLAVRVAISKLAEPVGRRSGDRADAGAHQADAVEVGLLAGAFLGAFAGLVALVEQFHLLEFLEGFGEKALGVLELDA